MSSPDLPLPGPPETAARPASPPPAQPPAPARAEAPAPAPATAEPSRPEVLVVGAGVAGATCARALADAGWHVTVVDKSRGVGGRLATRRTTWADPAGEEQPVAFDHGAPGFSAAGPAFSDQVSRWHQAGLLQPWQPRLSPDSYQALDTPLLWLPQPDMPALVRHLLHGLDCRLNQTVDALYHGPDGWRWHSPDDTAPPVRHLVLALPPAQLAPLLAPWRDDWARRARQTPMLPCWTLMAVASPADAWPDWQASWPTQGPLSLLLRQDSRPGRGALPVAGTPAASASTGPAARAPAAWVAHASPGFSQQHLESPPEAVRPLLQAALETSLGQHLHWHQAVMHRWRYATAPRADRLQPPGCWWDSDLRLGVCGDHLGGTGVEGAWRSGQALAQALLGGG